MIDAVIFAIYATLYKCSAGVRGRMGTHQGRSFRGIIGLHIPMNFTPLDGWSKRPTELVKV